jgi:uncharacterized protein (DUF1800 family)
MGTPVAVRGPAPDDLEDRPDPGEEEQQMAHLLRRAGFGSSRSERAAALAAGYERTVEGLLEAPAEPATTDELVDRYFPASMASHEWAMSWPHLVWPMLAGASPLREKVALFWHGIFCTGLAEGVNGLDQLRQYAMLRERGLGRFEDLLLGIAQDPAMLVYLDNDVNRADARNENFGRELLELFSMGEGSYGEQDVVSAARAFTGWAVRPAPSAFLVGPIPMEFEFRAAVHDSGDKEFLGQRGAFGGREVVSLIAAHPATARFVARRLHRYFVDDVEDAAEIDEIAATFTQYDGDIAAVLRHIFLADWFRGERHRRRRVKEPMELVVSLARQLREWTLPEHRMVTLVEASRRMGQAPFLPPNVGGWPHGRDWLHGANLVERVNTGADLVADASDHLLAEVGAPTDAEQLLQSCLAAIDLGDLSDESRRIAMAHAEPIPSETTDPAQRARRLLSLLVAAPEFQYS